MKIPVLRLTPLLRGVDSDCWCPSVDGACWPPFDTQRASGSTSKGSDVVEEVIVLLSGSTLQHLRDGLPVVAARHAELLAALLSAAS